MVVPYIGAQEVPLADGDLQNCAKFALIVAVEVLLAESGQEEKLCES